MSPHAALHGLCVCVDGGSDHENPKLSWHGFYVAVALFGGEVDGGGGGVVLLGGGGEAGEDVVGGGGRRRGVGGRQRRKGRGARGGGGAHGGGAWPPWLGRRGERRGYGRRMTTRRPRHQTTTRRRGGRRRRDAAEGVMPVVAGDVGGYGCGSAGLGWGQRRRCRMWTRTEATAAVVAGDGAGGDGLCGRRERRKRGARYVGGIVRGATVGQRMWLARFGQFHGIFS
uniref:Uncharacterized protein n=1 Tax=Oryza nivara TaxID=4536 RepID=A0A0E0HN46_ORYNI